MRELILKMSISLDGCVAASRADSDWMFRGRSPDSAAWVLDILSGAGVHAIGRRTFDDWAKFWPDSTSPVAEPMNEVPKVVFTRQHTFDPGAIQIGSGAAAKSWAEARVASGDLAREIERLKQEDGRYILAQGGVGFARSLVRAGLVDEYRFAVIPVALGSGQGLFTGLPGELDLALVDSVVFAGGVIGNVYRPRQTV